MSGLAFLSRGFQAIGISEFKRSLLLALLLTLALISSALADKRVALVIGNSTYKNVGPLDNPANDATLKALAEEDQSRPCF